MVRAPKWVGFVLCFEGFSLVSPVFLPQQKPAYSLFQLAVRCAPRSHMNCIVAARVAIVCFPFDLVELHRCCTLRQQLARLTIIRMTLTVDLVK